ncbi:MAG: hypothetical protein KDK60_04240, partial [Chlamydiia bacterium]|nr:hypothetical protein [Chlamydiia bacterium]
AGLQKGYLVWIGSKENPGCKLLRDNVEVKRVDGVFLKPGELYQISVQRQDTIFRLHINDEQKLLYSSYVPLMGGHFGLVSKDAEFEISPLTLSSGSQNVLVNCLSVPDAFLLNKDYERALTEYRRIASSFKGRPEGREAIFRAGITLIEEKNFEGALSEFERLDKTPGAPIEYLGKSLVYQAEKNLEEEIKCLELGLRKFPKHPLRTVLDDHILYRLHETAQKDRVGAYAFTLLSLRHLPNIVALNETKSLTQNLKVSWEELPFIVYPPLYANEKEEHLQLSIQLSFWLSRPNSLYELIESFPEKCKHWMTLLQNGLLSLYHLGYPKLIDYILTKKYGKVIDPKFTLMKNLFEVAIDDLTLPQKLDLVFSKGEFPLVVSLLEKGLTIKTAPLLFPYFKKRDLYEIERLWALLLSGKKKEAGEILDKKHYIDPPSITAMIKGCYLAMTEGEEAAYAHFAPLIETAHPPTSSLLGHYLKGHISLDGPWFKGAFFWEKIQLYRQLALYYHCLGNASKAAHFEEAIEKATTENQLPLNFI